MTDDRLSESDQREFQILDEYVRQLQTMQRDQATQLAAAHPELSELLSCVDALDCLAPLPSRPSHSVPANGGAANGDVLFELGRYEILAEIGRGGMGVVYCAAEDKLGRVVALKTILGSQHASDEEIRRFHREAEAAGKLRHPNIVGIHEAGCVNGWHYFSMDYIEGVSLAQRLRSGAIEPDEACRLLMLVARAVEYLHQNQIVHRDLKPGNILIDEAGRPFVTDFGLVKLFSDDSGHTQTGSILGTPSYMSPEQAAGRSAEISAQSDVYSIGAILYETLTGRPPFRFNPAAAQNAINATLTQFGAGSVDEAIADGATIADFAGNGLDSGVTYLGGGYPASEYGITPAEGAAFPGMNPLWGDMLVAYPIGRSVYNGLQMSYRQQIRQPFRGIRGGYLQTSYAFSRFVSTGGADQFFTPGIYDQDCPTCYIGPSGLDRTHQFSTGGYVQVSHGPMVGFTAHIYSSLPTNLNLEADPNGSPGEIFRTDVTGDGTTADLVPGTEPGAFMRQVKGNSINRLINQYNSQSANRLTPAGQVLVDNGFFTSGQMQELGAVTPSLATAPVNEANNPWLRTFDAQISYPIKLGERTSIEPQFSAYNLFNFGYFNNVGGTLESVSSLGQSAAGSSPQSANTTAGFYDRDSLRVANGSGTFQQGAPRELEFSMKLTF